MGIFADLEGESLLQCLLTTHQQLITHARHAHTQGTHARVRFHLLSAAFPCPLQAALGYVIQADLTGHPSCTGSPALLLGKGAPYLVPTVPERGTNSQQPLFAVMLEKLPAPTWSPLEFSGVQRATHVSLAPQEIFNKLFEGSFKSPFPHLEEKQALPTLLSDRGWDSALLITDSGN